jgi:large subunit ribosomal protein L10
MAPRPVLLFREEDILPKSRQQKNQMLSEYSSQVGRAQVVIWSKFQGLTMQQISELRAQLRGVGAEIAVVKNTLIRKALSDAKLPTDEAMMGGPCVVTFVYDNIPAATRIVTDYARSHEAVLSVSGGLLGHSLIAPKQVVSLVNMPSREVVLGQLMGAMQAPIVNVVSVLSGVMRGLVNVLDAHAKQLEGAQN